MTPDEREQINYLCKRIESEQDPVMFDRLVKELNDLLACIIHQPGIVSKRVIKSEGKR